MDRFYGLLIFCFIVSIISCNGGKEKPNISIVALDDSLEKQNLNKKSILVYVSSDEQYRFSIISRKKDGETEKILLQNDISGRIYDMKKVNSYIGNRYIDDDNYYLWINDDTFSFGKGDDIIVEGKSKLLPPLVAE